MLYATFSSPVNAPFATLWAMLVDKVENPQRYIAEVEESQAIHENAMSRDLIARVAS